MNSINHWKVACQMSISHLPHTKFWSNFVKSEIGLYAQKTIPLCRLLWWLVICQELTQSFQLMANYEHFSGFYFTNRVNFDTNFCAKLLCLENVDHTLKLLNVNSEEAKKSVFHSHEVYVQWPHDKVAIIFRGSLLFSTVKMTFLKMCYFC